jgi:hypothetical protein
MGHKTTHVHPDAIEAVETFYDDDGRFASQVVHISNGGKFSSSMRQYTTRRTTEGMLAVRGDLLEDGDELEQGE